MIERIGSLSLLRFAPSALGVFAPSIGPNQSRPTTAADALAAGALAAIDGPMFSRCDSGLTGTDAQRYAQSQCSRVDYRLYDAAAGVSVSSRHPTQGATFSVVNGAAVVRLGDAPADGATVAVQCYPHIVQRGANIASRVNDTDRTWRAALCVMRDGSMAFAVMVASMRTFAEALVDAGVLEGGYTDGGGSGRLATTEEVVGAGENRRVGSWLIVRGPGGGAGGAGGGSSSGGVLLPVLLLGAGGLIAWRVMRR